MLAIGVDGSTLLDSFTANDYDFLETNDIDLGSTAPVMLPRQPASDTPLMAVQGGKDGILKLLNRQRLGHVGGELQDYNLSPEIFSAPAVWIDSNEMTWIFVGTAAAVTAFRLETVAGRSALRFVWSSPAGGTSPVVANGIVYVATSGAVNAFNARTGHVLWSSSQPSAGGSIGDVHWESPSSSGAGCIAPMRTAISPPTACRSRDSGPYDAVLVACALGKCMSLKISSATASPVSTAPFMNPAKLMDACSPQK